MVKNRRLSCRYVGGVVDSVSSTASYEMFPHQVFSVGNSQGSSWITWIYRYRSGMTLMGMSRFFFSARRLLSCKGFITFVLDLRPSYMLDQVV
jgi:hypothetical protein